MISNPLKHEIDRIVAPVAQGYEQAQKYKSMLTVLLSDEETYDLLYDFGQRYWDATHPLELTEMGASAVADIVVTVLLAVVTAGVGAAANVAAKSGRLARAAELLEKIAATIRRVGHRTKLIGKAEDAFKAGKAETRAARAAKKAREAQTEVRNAERARKIEKQAQKEYDATKKIDGPKKQLDQKVPDTIPNRKFRDATKEDAEKIDSIRKKYGAGKGKNIAHAKGDIGGGKIDSESVSGKVTPENARHKGNFEVSDKHHYKGVEGFENHTEQKIVEHLRVIYKETPNISGKIEIISERPYCDNCVDVVDQFQKELKI